MKRKDDVTLDNPSGLSLIWTPEPTPHLTPLQSPVY
jgi:hypothetical protein